MEGIKSDRVSSSRSRSGDRNGGGSQLGKMREKKRSPSSSSGRSSPGRNSQDGSVDKRRRVRREGRKSRSSSRERFIRNREKSKSWLQHPGKRRNERFGRRRTSPLYSRYGPRFNYLRNRSPRRQVGRFGPNRWGDRGDRNNDRNNDFHYRRDNNRRPSRYSPRSSPERTPERRRSDGERPATAVSADEKSADEGTKQEPKTPNSDYEEKSEKGSKSGSNIDDVLNLLDSTSADLKLLNRKSSPSSSDESSSNSSSSEAKKRKHKSKSRKKPKKEKKKKHKKSDRSRSVSKSKSKKKAGEDAKSKAKCTSREAEELLKLLSGPIEITAPQSVSSSKQERFHNDGPSTSGDYKHHRSDSRSDERRHSNDNRKRDSGQRNDSDSRKRQRQS